MTGFGPEADCPLFDSYLPLAAPCYAYTRGMRETKRSRVIAAKYFILSFAFARAGEKLG